MSEKRIGYVYFAQVVSDGPIKVGFSVRYPDGRLRELQVACPFPLERRGYIFRDLAYERFLHLAFAHLSLHGEWFSPGPDLVRFIQRCASTWKPLGPRDVDPTPSHRADAVHRHDRRRQRAMELEDRAFRRYMRDRDAARLLKDRSVRHETELLAQLRYSRTEGRARALSSAIELA